MLRPFQNLSLSMKASILGAGSVLVTLIAMLLLTVWQSAQYNKLAQGEVDKLIDTNLDNITRSVVNLVQTEDAAVHKQVNDNLNVARYVLKAAGGLSFALETIPWEAVNQVTLDRTPLRLPKMLLGGRWLGRNTDPHQETPVVDQITGLVGDTSTIFQRMNARGDMLRVATNVQDPQRRRAVGTYIPAVNPDGTPNPVLAEVLAGRTYLGRAYVVGEWYFAAYEPIRDGHGRVVGMLYVGIPQKGVEARIRQAILQTRVGRTGYVYVMTGRGEDRGRYVISQRGERDGENIWGSSDLDGHKIIQNLIRKALGLHPGELGTEKYRWINPDDPQPHWKIARLAYFEPWDWVIGTGVDLDELQGFHAILQGGRARMARFMGIAGAVLALGIGLLGIILSWTLTGPIQRMTRAVEALHSGGQDLPLQVESRDEIGTLAQAFNSMLVHQRQMVSELAQSNESLEKSEAMFKSFFYNTNVAITTTTVDGKLKANKAFCQIHGYTEEELNHMHWQDITHPDDLAICTLNVDAVLAGTMAIARWEKRYIHKDGHVVLADISISLQRDPAGNPLFFITTLTDITEQRRAEQERAILEGQLLQAQKMESVGRLAGGVAHDINNMLAAIMGHIELMRLVSPPDSPNHRRLEQMEKAAWRSRDIVRQLLAFSRKQVIDPVVFSLNARLEETRKALAPLLGEDIDLRFLPCAGLWNIKADPTQVDQVLMNLAVNARDAMPRGGRLTIETQGTHLDEAYCRVHPEAKPGDFVMLAVSDTGCGIEAKVLANIFEPFYTTKDQSKGTGLGLSTVFGILKQCGGFINVYSEVGRGTTFRIYFPAVSEAQAEVAPEVAAQHQATGGRILIVEDDVVLLGVIPQMLEQLGYSVRVARSGDEVLQMDWEAEGPFDLLLTDVIMPGMNGQELSNHLRALHPELKVLFMSGYTANIITQTGVLGEGNHFIAKPFILADLGRKLASLIGG